METNNISELTFPRGIAERAIWKMNQPKTYPVDFQLKNFSHGGIVGNFSIVHDFLLQDKYNP